MYAYPLTALATMLIVLLQFWMVIRVGRERVRSQIKAPAVHGDPGLERAIRIHGNTIEQLAMFLPALWLSLPLIGDHWAALIGAVWLVGRLHYAISYQRDPSARGPGFILTILPLGAAVAAALCGLVLHWLA